MSDFFMHFTGFLAIGRVLRRRGVALPVIGDIKRETYKAQLLTVPEAERLTSGKQFLSAENRLAARAGGEKSRGRIQGRFRPTISSSRSRRQFQIWHQIVVRWRWTRLPACGLRWPGSIG